MELSEQEWEKIRIKKWNEAEKLKNEAWNAFFEEASKYPDFDYDETLKFLQENVKTENFLEEGF